LKRGSLWAVAVAGLLAGCATLKAPLESRGEQRFDQALEALARGDYRTAHEGFSWVAQNDPDKKHGQQAMLILAAVELDPRNPGRRIGAGTDVAARYLGAGEGPVWTNPVAQTLYLLGLELGAAEDRVEKAEREAERAAARLPTLPGPSVSARIRTIEQERERLSKRVETLEKQLAEKEQELERIKKTIRP
jgi:TolA-binding protein